jgi:CHAT domain-containing protein
MGQSGAAIFFGKNAVNTVQAMRSSIVSLDESLQQSFLETKTIVYRSLADLLIEAGRIAEAQEVLSLLKEEEYLEFINRDAQQAPHSARLSLSDAEQQVASLLARHFAASSQKIAELERLNVKLKEGYALTRDEQARRAELRADLVQARAAFQRFLAALPLPSQARIKTSQAMSTSTSDAFKKILAQHRDAALVQYVLGPERLSIVLTLPDSTSFIQRDLDARTVNRRIQELHKALADRTDVSIASKALYDELIAPVEAQLSKARVRNLLLSLDGSLRYIPFAALHDGERYLAERYGITVLTHSARLSGSNTPSRGNAHVGGLGVTKGSLKLGMKPLPAVQDELRQIVNDGTYKGLLPGRTFLDEAFTPDRLRTLIAERVPILHVASHFQFRPGSERDSFLLLGNDTRLTIENIRQMNLDLDAVDLLTLSACQTGVADGSVAQGVEFEGFGALLANQGAKHVVATLWQVADASSAPFMVEFYRQRVSNPTGSVADALRAAQIAFLRGEAGSPDAAKAQAGRYTHPFYWSAYVLMQGGR